MGKWYLRCREHSKGILTLGLKKPYIGPLKKSPLEKSHLYETILFSFIFSSYFSSEMFYLLLSLVCKYNIFSNGYLDMIRILLFKGVLVLKHSFSYIFLLLFKGVLVQKTFIFLHIFVTLYSCILMAHCTCDTAPTHITTNKAVILYLPTQTGQ